MEILDYEKSIDFYDIMHSSICKNITYKLTKHSDFKTLALNSMADLYFGHNNERLQNLLENMFDYVTTASDISIKTLFNKITTNREPIKRVSKYIRNNNMHNSIFSRFSMFFEFPDFKNIKIRPQTTLRHPIYPTVRDFFMKIVQVGPIGISNMLVQKKVENG